MRSDQTVGPYPIPGAVELFDAIKSSIADPDSPIGYFQMVNIVKKWKRPYVMQF
jgi:hypothetical protein